MKEIGPIFLAITGGIIGLAVLSVVLSSQSNTTNVLTSLFTGITNLITAATKPIGSSALSGLTNI